jgi:hypothetical protein
MAREATHWMSPRFGRERLVSLPWSPWGHGDYHPRLPWERGTDTHTSQSLAHLALPAADALAIRLQAEPLAHTPGAQPLAHHPSPCSDAVAVRSQVDSPARTAHPQTPPAHPPHSASGTLTGVEQHNSSLHEQHPPSRRTTPADRPDGPQDGDMAVVGPTTLVRRVCAHISRWCRLLLEAVT